MLLRHAAGAQRRALRSVLFGQPWLAARPWQDCALHVTQVSRTLTQRISTYAGVVLESVAYAGTGDVLKVQRLLALCGEHTEVDEASAWKVGRCTGCDSM